MKKLQSHFYIERNQIMNSNLTEMIFILDRSGSMSGLEKDTIGGFNSMIERQKKEEGTAYVSTVLFSNDSEVIHDRIDIGKVEPLTEKQYFVGGCTALMDAMGDAIHHIKNVHKYAREEDRPAHTIMVVITDGMENASRRFSSDSVKALVKKRQEEGWEFIFLGANIDAVETAAQYGIAPERAATFHNDSRGIEKNFSVLSSVCGAVRRGRALDESCLAEISADFESRK